MVVCLAAAGLHTVILVFSCGGERRLTKLCICSKDSITPWLGLHNKWLAALLVTYLCSSSSVTTSVHLESVWTALSEGLIKSVSLNPKNISCWHHSSRSASEENQSFSSAGRTMLRVAGNRQRLLMKAYLHFINDLFRLFFGMVKESGLP